MVTNGPASKNQWGSDEAKAQQIVSLSSTLAMGLANCSLRLDGFKTFDYIPKTWLRGGPTSQHHDAFLHFVKSCDVEKIVSDSIAKCDELLKTDPNEAKSILAEHWRRNYKSEIGIETPALMANFVDTSFQKIREVANTLKEIGKEIGIAMKTPDMEAFSDIVEDILENVKKIDAAQSDVSDFLYVMAHGPNGIGAHQFLEGLRR